MNTQVTSSAVPDPERTPPAITACIQAMEERLRRLPSTEIDIRAVYAARCGPWLRRVHEVLYSWSLASELPNGYCTYRYSGMETALTRKCKKTIKQDAITKILRILDEASVIARPKRDSMVRLPREGLGYPIKVLVAPPEAHNVQTRVLTAALAAVEEKVALDVIMDYLHPRELGIAGNFDPDHEAW